MNTNTTNVSPGSKRRAEEVAQPQRGRKLTKAGEPRALLPEVGFAPEPEAAAAAPALSCPAGGSAASAAVARPATAGALFGAVSRPAPPGALCGVVARPATGGALSGVVATRPATAGVLSGAVATRPGVLNWPKEAAEAPLSEQRPPGSTNFAPRVRSTAQAPGGSDSILAQLAVGDAQRKLYVEQALKDKDGTIKRLGGELKQSAYNARRIKAKVDEDKAFALATHLREKVVLQNKLDESLAREQVLQDLNSDATAKLKKFNDDKMRLDAALALSNQRMQRLQETVEKREQRLQETVAKHTAQQKQPPQRPNPLQPPQPPQQPQQQCNGFAPLGAPPSYHEHQAQQGRQQVQFEQFAQFQRFQSFAKLFEQPPQPPQPRQLTPAALTEADRVWTSSMHSKYGQYGGPAAQGDGMSP